MRYLLMLVGVLLVLFAGAKTYFVFQKPDVGPELMADATVAVLGAVFCFAIGATLKKRTARS